MCKFPQLGINWIRTVEFQMTNIINMASKNAKGLSCERRPSHRTYRQAYQSNHSPPRLEGSEAEGLKSTENGEFKSIFVFLTCL